MWPIVGSVVARASRTRSAACRGRDTRGITAPPRPWQTEGDARPPCGRLGLRTHCPTETTLPQDSMRSHLQSTIGSVPRPRVLSGRALVENDSCRHFPRRALQPDPSVPMRDE